MRTVRKQSKACILNREREEEHQSHKRDGRTAEKHGETEATEKSSKKFQDFFQLHRNRRGK
jgi:hypothetical protein